MSKWYKPTATVTEAVFSIRWSYAILIFIAPPTLVGMGEGIPLVGFSFGFGFVLFILILQWWFGPI